MSEITFDSLFEEITKVEISPVAAQLGYVVLREGDRFIAYNGDGEEIYRSDSQEDAQTAVYDLAIAEQNAIDASEPLDLDELEKLFEEPKVLTIQTGNGSLTVEALWMGDRVAINNSIIDNKPYPDLFNITHLGTGTSLVYGLGDRSLALDMAAIIDNAPEFAALEDADFAQSPEKIAFVGGWLKALKAAGRNEIKSSADGYREQE